MSTFLLQQFDMLDVKSKMAHLQEHGIDLEVSLFVDSYKISLFYLYDFYVEVQIDKASGSIVDLLPFDCYSRLDAYMPYINIMAACVTWQ